MLVADGLIPAVGLVFTITLAEAVAVQLFVLVTVTVKLYPPALVLLNRAVAALLLKLPPTLLAQA